MAPSDMSAVSVQSASARSFDSQRKANGFAAPSFKLMQSAHGHKRRASLPLHFLPPALWSANTSRASLVESEEAARGEHILDEATIAHRIAALRQLNGATSNTHRYAKSTGARNSTFSQPVIVRTYSGSRSQSSQGETPNKKLLQNMGTAELPPLEAFTFKGIMDSIQNDVADDLERIAEICARSRYSLSNQYEVHMPPHGEGSPFLLHATGNTTQMGGPTLEAIGSDDEHAKPNPRNNRTGRRSKSMAMGTLETIMSSSKSSDEEKTKKKPAAEIAEGVRGRTARKASAVSSPSSPREENAGTSTAPRSPQHTRSRSTTFASMMIEGAQALTASELISPNSLVSEPAKPQTSSATLEETIIRLTDPIAITTSTLDTSHLSPHLVRNDSRASNLRPDSDRLSVLDSLTSWLPWGRPSGATSSSVADRTRFKSHAEGSLRYLLEASRSDSKGKQVDHGS